MPGSRKQEKTMHHHHQKQRCFMLCSRHCHHARALSQRSRRGRVLPMGQFKAWGPGATTTSPRITSASRVDRGTLWLERASPISTSIGLSISIAGDDPYETVFSIFKGPAAPHQIRLLKSNHHFDGCTSFPAFLNRSYYCLDCEWGFNTNDRTNHTCHGNRCSA